MDILASHTRSLIRRTMSQVLWSYLSRFSSSTRKISRVTIRVTSDWCRRRKSCSRRKGIIRRSTHLKRLSWSRLCPCQRQVYPSLQCAAGSIQLLMEITLAASTLQIQCFQAQLQSRPAVMQLKCGMPWSSVWSARSFTALARNFCSDRRSTTPRKLSLSLASRAFGAHLQLASLIEKLAFWTCMRRGKYSYSYLVQYAWSSGRCSYRLLSSRFWRHIDASGLEMFTKWSV